jgi:protein TonB
VEVRLGPSLRFRSAALLVSLGVHATFFGALFLAAGPSPRGTSAPAGTAGELVWIDLGSASGGAPGRPEASSPRPRARPVAASAERRTATTTAPTSTPRHDAPSARAIAATPIRTTPAPPVTASDAPSVKGSDAALTEAPPVSTPPPAAARTADTTPSTARGGPVADPSAPGALASGGDGRSKRPAWPGPGSVDRPARPRGPIRPDYPPLARRRGRESIVVVEAWVDDGGDVAFSSIVESGGSDFDISALTAVERAAFLPARLAGRAVPSRVALRIHFDLLD